MGLRLRVMLVFLLLAGLSTGVVVAGVALPKLGQYEKVDLQLAATARQSVDLASRYVDARLADARKRLAGLVGHEFLAYRNHAQAGTLLKSLSAQVAGHPPIVVLDRTLNAVAASEPLPQRDFSHVPLARLALGQAGPLTGGLITWPGTERAVVASARRFRYYDRQGEHWGVVLTTESLSAWNQELNGQQRGVEVYDARGHQIVPPPVRVADAPEVSSADVRQALAGGKGTQSEPDHDLVAYAPVPAAGWAVLVRVPAAQALLPLDEDLRQVLVAGAVALLLAAVLAIGVSGFLVAPIRQLEAGAAAIARGEWDAGVSKLPGTRRDELGRLAVSFAAMADQLRERFDASDALVAERTSELERANALLRSAVAELRELDELKRAFLDAVSHELRTPLNFIMGYGSTLEDGMFGPLNAEQEHAVARMLEGSDRLLGVINDLIEISQLEAGQLALRPMPIDLGELVAIALAQQERALAEREHTVTLELASDLPPAYADPERVGQILRQLLSNAVKFTEPGGQLTVRARVRGDRLVVEVADNGVGIAPATQPLIWESFRQGDGSMTRRYGGTGVGLAIVKRLLDAMGETITLESAPGKGSCFAFTLPVAELEGLDDPEHHTAYRDAGRSIEV